MKRAESLFESVFKDLGLFIAIIDKQGMILAVNEKAGNIAGHLSDDITDMHLFSMFTTDVMSSSHGGNRTALPEGMIPERFLWTIPIKDGSTIKIMCSSDPLYDNGDIEGAIIYGIEIPDTQKKSDGGVIEDRLRLYNDLLSHDIKNYNQVALGYLEMARERPGTIEVESMLEHAYDAIKRSNDLVICVKKLIDIESGAPIEPLIESLNDIIDRNIRSIRQAHPPDAIEFTLTGNFDVAICSCVIIDDAFYNVLDNAVRYDRHKKVRVDIVAATRADGLVDVSINDRGPGIPDKMKDAVFMRNNKSAHGWGMGLSIARAVVERLGGHIAVSDRVHGDRSKGSVFTITLPKAKLKK